MNQLESRFDEAMIRIYKDALHDCNYRATAFLDMLHDYRGVATAKRLLAGSQAQSGLYELNRCDRLDLTLEAVVVREEFQPLFTAEELAEARRRLKELNYKGPM